MPSPEPPPARDRAAHGKALLAQLGTARLTGENQKAEAISLGLPEPEGMSVSFASDPNINLAVKSLEAESSGIRLLAVKQEGSVTVASVFVPTGRLKILEKKIEAYVAEDVRGREGKPKNEKLVASIGAISRAVAEKLWSDDEPYPTGDDRLWWEVWIRASVDGREEDRFRQAATRLGLEVRERSIAFVDRRVLVVRASRSQIERSVDLLDMMAELRRAKDSPSDFTQMHPREQKEWLADLLSRLEAPPAGSPAVCLLDHGLNSEHPLLALATTPEDVQAVDRRWSASDHSGHGTEMAGLALYGDLHPLLGSRDPVVLEHRLESVKLVPAQGQNHPDLYGAITRDAIRLAEGSAPGRSRVACMTVSSQEARTQGKPSSWSAEIDALASGADGDEARLVVVSAGNVEQVDWFDYPDSNLTASIHDPAQAWNALTVGAFTDRTQIDPGKYPDWSLVAPPGGLAPSSSTSLTWNGEWPFKPDVVLEGGNGAVDPGRTRVEAADDLSLLTTHRFPAEKPFVTSGDTSAAAAQAARLAAVLLAEYPGLWPETLRALLVHGATWTPRMVSENPLRNMDERRAMLRTYGHGVPDLEKARWSLRNDVALVAQDHLQPFEKTEDGRIRAGEMNVHRLPWPTEVLRDLGEAPVKLRITLSYFIEPNPARRGFVDRYPYPSHGLRFSVIRPGEKLDSFRARINKAARDESPSVPSVASEDDGWTLGPKTRERGSLHADTWSGMAAQLADRSVVAIYPVGGWWKERKSLGRWQQAARYALIVSISTPETEIDLYTPITNMIGTPVPISV